LRPACGSDWAAMASNRMHERSITADDMRGSIAASRPTPSPQLSDLRTGSAHHRRVISTDDGRPVRRAQVHLSGHPDSEPDYMRVTRTFETDLNGRFEFVDLPAGVYAIFFDRLTGFVKPAGYNQTTLTARQTVDISIRLERTGAIEGRILDDNGDPMLGATVMAIDRTAPAGIPSWGTRLVSAQTNDRGEFRIFNLPAGDYYLAASRPYPQGPHEPPPPIIGYVTTYSQDRRTVRTHGPQPSARPGRQLHRSG
jgi:hypothetical protein